MRSVAQTCRVAARASHMPVAHTAAGLAGKWAGWRCARVPRPCEFAPTSPHPPLTSHAPCARTNQPPTPLTHMLQLFFRTASNMHGTVSGIETTTANKVCAPVHPNDQVSPLFTANADHPRLQNGRAALRAVFYISTHLTFPSAPSRHRRTHPPHPAPYQTSSLFACAGVQCIQRAWHGSVCLQLCNGAD